MVFEDTKESEITHVEDSGISTPQEDLKGSIGQINPGTAKPAVRASALRLYDPAQDRHFMVLDDGTDQSDQDGSRNAQSVAATSL